MREKRNMRERERERERERGGGWKGDEGEASLVDPSQRVLWETAAFKH